MQVRYLMDCILLEGHHFWRQKDRMPYTVLSLHLMAASQLQVYYVPALYEFAALQLESEDERFRAVPQEVPWASIALAIFLMIFGVFSFVLAWLHLTQRLLGKEQAVSRCHVGPGRTVQPCRLISAWCVCMLLVVLLPAVETAADSVGTHGAPAGMQEIGFTILGAMTFVPGAYHTYIAYGAYRGWSGFSYDRCAHAHDHALKFVGAAACARSGCTCTHARMRSYGLAYACPPRADARMQQSPHAIHARASMPPSMRCVPACSIPQY